MQSKRTSIVRIIAALVTTSAGSTLSFAQCDPTFEFIDSGQSLGNAPSNGVSLGDVDGDGDLDAVVANGGYAPGPHPNTVWLNDGEGNFSDSGQVLGTVASSDCVLGDFDGDEDLDVLFMNFGFGWPPPRHTVWLNDGNGLFSNSGQAIQTYYSGVGLGDLDGDGDLDLMFSNYDRPETVWLNNGDGVFSDSGQQIGFTSSNDLVLGDFDGDDDLDALVLQELVSPNVVLLNDGDGNFTPSGQSLGNLNSGDAAVGDVDGDGDLDILVSNCCTDYQVGVGEPNTLWLNDGSGSFAESDQTLGSNESGRVAFVDLDEDGDLDVLEGVDNTPGQPFIQTWLNDGSGGFTACTRRIEIGSVGWNLGDLDGDGDMDMMIAGADPLSDGDTALPNTVWLNGSACPGDLSTDGGVDGQDLTILLGDWGGSGAGDLDRDGSTGGSDLAILLGAWGACP